MAVSQGTHFPRGGMHRKSTGLGGLKIPAQRHCAQPIPLKPLGLLGYQCPFSSTIFPLLRKDQTTFFFFFFLFFPNLPNTFSNACFSENFEMFHFHSKSEQRYTSMTGNPAMKQNEHFPFGFLNANKSQQENSCEASDMSWLLRNCC